MRILWYAAAPWVGSGYGQQSALFVPRIAKQGHQVAFASAWGSHGSLLAWNSPDGQTFPVYPAMGHTWDIQKRWLPIWAQNWAGDQPCKLITLIDAWTLIGETGLRSHDLACWTPVDHKPLPVPVHEFFKESGARPIAMSRFGEQAMRDADLDPLYVPHGIDTTVFRPLPDRDEIRSLLGIDKDTFVVGMVAANNSKGPSRKGFPEAFAAFAELRRRHDDVRLYLHSDLTGLENGLKLVLVAEKCGVPINEIAHTDQALLQLGMPASDIAVLYNTFDVLLNPSYGEGFGIPVVEAQACGTPVVVTDWTAMAELCGAGWKVGGQEWFDNAQGAFFKVPSVTGLVDALEDAYEHAAGLRDQAREFALAYDADRVMDEFWTPVLAELAKPREVPPLASAPGLEWETVPAA